MRIRMTGARGTIASAVAAALVILGSSACAPTSPTLPSPETEPALAAPKPLSPINDVVAGSQNDPTTGCPATDPSRGTGMKIDFEWEAVPGAVAYLGCFWRGGNEALACPASTPPYGIRSGFHSGETHISVVQCGFVQDFLRSDWHWKVAARSATGGWGPYSPPMTFTFSPCRLSDGRPCSA